MNPRILRGEEAFWDRGVQDAGQDKGSSATKA